MAAQKVVISKDLKADLQAFFASMSYDKLFILTDTNTQEKCYPLIKDCLLYTSPSPRDS